MKRLTTLLLLAALALPVLTASGPLLAGPLPPEVETTELMMELQGMLATWLGINYGPSEDLQFSSFTDVSSKTFSFNLLPGATYAGQSAMLTASGAFDALNNEWDYLASGSVGIDSWSATGTAVDPPQHWFPEIDISRPLGPPTKVESSVSITVTENAVFSQGTSVVRNATTNAIISQSAYSDAWQLKGTKKDEWKWKTGQVSTSTGPMRVVSEGSSPVEGGVGQFTTRITAVPEPSMPALIIMATIAIGPLSRKRPLAA
jgi:hypothetical protein